jgi:hypothetical protein
LSKFFSTKFYGSNFNTATSITTDKTYYETLNSGDTYAYYKISLLGFQKYAVSVNFNSRFLLGISIYEQNRNFISSSIPQICCVAVEHFDTNFGGIFYIEISIIIGSGNANFELSVLFAHQYIPGYTMLYLIIGFIGLIIIFIQYKHRKETKFQF